MREAANVEPDEAVSRPPVNILLVDDRPENLQILQLALTNAAYNLVPVLSGRDAIEYLRMHEVALILLDVQMPHMDGFELARTLRASERGTDAPIIFLTSMHTEFDDLEKGYSLGAVDYICRPISLRILRSKVDNFVELYRKTLQVQQQAALLRESEQNLEALVAQRTLELEASNRKLVESNQELARTIRQQQQTEHELRRTLARANALYSVTRALAAVERLPDVLRAVADSVADALPADLLSIVSLDIEAEQIVDVVVGGAQAERWFPVSFDTLMEGYTGQALRDKRSVLSLDGIRHPAASLAPENSPESAWNDGSVIVVPLQYRERTLGLMIALKWGLDQPFTPSDVELMDAMASQSAMAIEHAHLFEEMHQTLQHMRHIMNSVPAGVLLLDAEYRVLLANPLAREYLPLLTAPEQFEQLVSLGGQVVTKLLVNGSAVGGVVTLQGADSSLFECEASFVQTEKMGKQWVLIVRDVTQERAAQEHLQTQQRQATIGQLAAGIAHDFNNILAVITLYSQMLTNTITEPKLARYLKTIHQQAGRGAGLVSQLLDFSRRSLIECRPLNIVSFLYEVCDLLKHTLPDNITLDFRYPSDSLYVNVDPTRLQQVFMNLAINARDAMPDGGSLSIEVSQQASYRLLSQSKPSEIPGPWLRITVSDTGCGMPEEVQKRLFEPFFTTKPPDRGTGLGLAQVHGIIHQFNGQIDVQSRLGAGTAFSIYLPQHDVVQDIPCAPSVTAAHTDSTLDKAILIVEDDLGVRDALDSILRSLGYQHILLAEDGRSALRIVRHAASTVDLVISDIVMPEMGGLELHQVLREEFPFIKMILSTGYPLDDDGQLLRAGIVDWVQKPFTIEEIAGKVRKALAE